LALGTAVTWALTAIYYLEAYQNVPFSALHLLVEAIEFLAGVPLVLAVAWITRLAGTRAQLRDP
jgi:predicted cupin superfamily sugar epimerase